MKSKIKIYEIAIIEKVNIISEYITEISNVFKT
jgi:hypothetical protein